MGIHLATSWASRSAGSAQDESFSITLDPVKHGSIKLDPPVPEDGKYPAGTVVTVRATPAEGYAVDSVYYSAMVYTTVGFGDMVPSGGLRLITATEALVGLSLITWSASFTYFQMQTVFGDEESES